MAKSANDYKRYISSSGWEGAASGAATWVSTGAAVGSAFGGVGALVGGAAGLIIGGLMGLFSNSKAKEELRGQRTTYLNSRNEAQKNMNELIVSAKNQVNTTRNEIDAIYGTGTFDLYDELFAEIFNLPENSSTLNDIFENASVDQYYGTRLNNLSGSYDMSQGAQSMSLSDINAGYQEYLTSLIRSGDTAIGLSFKRRNIQEKNLIESYYSDVDSYRLQMAESFKNAFLNRVSEQAAGEQSLGEAAVAQATSGIRQQAGGGTNLTLQQRFQNDIASIAYASTMNYAIAQYEAYMSNANKSLTASVEDIRIQNSIDSLNALNSIISEYNKQTISSWEHMNEYIDQDKIYEEADTEIDAITEALDDDFKPDMEEIF